MFEIFYWNYYAIGYLNAAIFILLSGAVMLAIPERSRTTFHLGMFFVSASVLAGGFAAAHAAYIEGAVYHRFFTIVGTLAAEAHVAQFLLYFPNNRPLKSARVLLAIQYVVILGAVAYFAVATRTVERIFFSGAHLWDFDADLISEKIGRIILAFAAIYIVIGIYRAVKLRGSERWLCLGLLAAFISTSLVPGILNLLSRAGALDRATFVTFFTLVTVIGCFAIVILFINNTTDRTTFMMKITGISLVTILVVFQLLAFFTLQQSNQSFDEIYTREGALHLRGIPSARLRYSYVHQMTDPDGGKKPEATAPGPGQPRPAAESAPPADEQGSVDFAMHSHEFENTLILHQIASLPADNQNALLSALLKKTPPSFSGYAELIRKFQSQNPNARPRDILDHLVSFERLIHYRSVKIRQLPDANFRQGLEKFLEGSGKEFAVFADALRRHLGQSKSEGRELKEEALMYLTPAHAPGYRWYRNSTDGKTQFVAYMHVTGPSQVTELGFAYRDYRAFLSETGTRVVIVLICTLLFVLVGFRIFFSGALLTPLEALLRAVRKVNAGNLSVEVPPRVEDEIGFLTRSFNGMVRSIREAREKLQEYAASLEEKVKERTAELQETLTQVQSLKTQQDGDYFLTALLLRPLRANRAKSDAVSVEFFQRQKKNFTFRHWQEEIGGDLCMSNNLKLGGRPFTVFMNADAMGKSMQGAGGALVLGSVFEAILERTHLSTSMQEQFPERWIKNAFIELHKVFEAFECSMMVSLVIGLIDEASGLLYYINAEHPFSMMYRRGKATFLDNETLFKKLGSPVTSGDIFIRTFQLEPGDVIIVGSDGRDDILMTEEGREPFMNEDETMILRHVENADADLQKMYEALKEMGTIIDDLTFIRVGYRESGHIRVETEHQREIRDLLSRAAEMTREGRHDAAAKELEAAHKLDDHHPEVLKRLTLAYIKQKRYDLAAPIVEDYSYLRPGDTELVYVASYCFKKIKNYARSADFGERVKLRNPRYVKNLINLAEVYARMGNRSRAQGLLDVVLDLEPGNQKAKKWLDTIRDAA